MMNSLKWNGITPKKTRCREPMTMAWTKASWLMQDVWNPAATLISSQRNWESRRNDCFFGKSCWDGYCRTILTHSTPAPCDSRGDTIQNKRSTGSIIPKKISRYQARQKTEKILSSLADEIFSNLGPINNAWKKNHPYMKRQKNRPRESLFEYYLCLSLRQRKSPREIWIKQ